jgi:hypothetical protein
MVHAKPTAQNSTAAGKTRLSGLGGIESKGQSDGADFGRFRAIEATPIFGGAVAAGAALAGCQHVSQNRRS